MKNQLKILCVALALTLAGQVSADTTWTLASNYGAISSGVTVSAYANTGGTSTANNAALQTIQSATWVNTYGGISNADKPTGSWVNTRGGQGYFACATSQGSDCDSKEGTSPEHAIDNNERYDMALLSFTSSVNLTKVKLGWYSGDSDITVMAYTGAGAPTLIGETYDELVDLGWTTVGNYKNVGTTNPVSTGASVYSSYWLIGAYNPLAAGYAGSGGSTSGFGVGSDNIKLASVTGGVCTGGSGPGCTTTTTEVPEPGSMALFGIALVGLFGLRKYQKS